MHDVAKTLSDRGFPFESKQIKSKFDDLKKIWKEWLAHIGRVSGWGRNDEDVPVNTREVEDEYFNTHAEAKQFRKKAPVGRAQLEVLLGSSAASGDFASGVDDLINLVGNEGEGGEEDETEEQTGAAATQETGGDNRAQTPIDQIRPRFDPGSGRGGRSTTNTPTARGRGQALLTAGQSESRRPSATRSHRSDDAQSLSLERSINKTSEAIYELARSQATPVESALTRATARVSSLPVFQSLDPRRRMQLLRVLPKDGNADMVLGLSGEADVVAFVEMLLEELGMGQQSHAQAGPQFGEFPGPGSYGPGRGGPSQGSPYPGSWGGGGGGGPY